MSTVNDPSLPGGSRQITLQSTPAGFTDTTVGVTSGVLFLSTPPALPLSITTLDYAGLSGNPMDLTVNGGTAFYFQVITQDHDATWTVTAGDALSHIEAGHSLS